MNRQWIRALSVLFVLLLCYLFLNWAVGGKCSEFQRGPSSQIEADSFGTWGEDLGVMRGQFFLLNDSTLAMVLEEVVAKGQPYKIEGILCVECPRQDLGLILMGDIAKFIYPGDSDYNHYAAKFLLQK